ncbi:MAG: hypothetical protein AAGD17_10075 [Bacteroidota bacterium]
MRKYRKQSSLGWLVTIHRTGNSNWVSDQPQASIKAGAIQESILNHGDTQCRVCI